MKKKVILTHRFQDKVIEKLRTRYDLVIARDMGMSLSELAADNSNCEALIPFLSDRIDKKIFDLFPKLKIIANYAVGYNNIDINEATRRGITVTNTPDVLTDATADLTIGLILAVSRRIPEADKYMRNGEFKGWDANLMLGKGLKGAVLGIVGLGKIGAAVAKRAKAFGMKIIYNSRTRKEELENNIGLEFVEMEKLITHSDIISLHLPYTKKLFHMFDSKKFEKMKKDSIFINVARGPMMNEEHLADAIISGHLFGAGIDVFEEEPKVNSRLVDIENVVMTPHIGSATYEARIGMAEIVLDNISAIFEGREPLTPVN